MKLILPRAEMTILGGLIALATFVLWPTWERSQAPEMLAQLLEVYREYFNAVAKARIDARAVDEAELSFVRMAARLARSNARRRRQTAEFESQTSFTLPLVCTGRCTRFSNNQRKRQPAAAVHSEIGESGHNTAQLD